MVCRRKRSRKLKKYEAEANPLPLGHSEQTDEQEMRKSLAYKGPMTQSDIVLASWNDFFHEGGSMNQPVWLETNRLKELRKHYVRLANLHVEQK